MYAMFMWTINCKKNLARNMFFKICGFLCGFLFCTMSFKPANPSILTGIRDLQVVRIKGLLELLLYAHAC
jgi:hypothetical protein